MIITLLVIMSSSVQPDINDVSPMVLIDRVTFVGNRRIDQHTLQKLISVKKGDRYDEEKLKIGLNRIIEYYLQDGLIFAEISPRIDLKGEHAQICVKVHEGETVEFGNVSIEGNTKFTDSYLLSLIGLRQGQPFNMPLLEKGIERIINLYSEQGHPMVEMRLVDVIANPDNGKLDLRVEIDEKKHNQNRVS